MNPRLSIIIPTHDRPELLPRALDSALRQTVPCKVVVADDGDIDRTTAILAGRYAEAVSDGRIRHLPTGAAYAWDNWRAGMEAADTEFACFHQDDDIVRPTYAARIIDAFDRYPQANVWLARLNCAPDGKLAMWYCGNGPWVPMDMVNGEPACFAEGSILASSSYLTSWSLSPAIAYRRGPWLDRGLQFMPADCDMFVERLVPALVADGGPFIADPLVAGYWIQHADQLSHKQYPDQPRQTKILVEFLDEYLPGLAGWRESFLAWLQLVPAGQVMQWLGILDQTEREGGKSRHGDELRRLMVESLKGRVQVVSGPRPRWRRVVDRAIGWVRNRAAL